VGENVKNTDVNEGWSSTANESLKYPAIRFESKFGSTYEQVGYSRSYGMFINDNKALGGGDILYYGVVARTDNKGNLITNLSVKDENTLLFDAGVFLVSDGGTTLSSIENPSLNINNANAPINQVPLPTTLGLLGLAVSGMSFRRRSK
jgi:hypothetical protein